MPLVASSPDIYISFNLFFHCEILSKLKFFYINVTEKQHVLQPFFPQESLQLQSCI